MTADAEQQAHFAIGLAGGFHDADLDPLAVEAPFHVAAVAGFVGCGRFEGDVEEGEGALGGVMEADVDGAGDGAS